MKQMTPAEERQYVQDHWNDCQYGIMIYCCDNGLPIAWHSFLSWHEAYLFTVQRERRIEDVKEEIEAVRSIAYSTNVISASVCERILAGKRAALAELRRGWKEQG